MPIAPALQRFVDDELARAPALVERTLAGTRQLLRDGKESPLPATERSHQFALVEALQTHATAYQHAFVRALRQDVTESLQEQQGSGGALSKSGAALELMDESSVEIDIEISRAMQLIDTTAEWELRELQTFTSTLVGHTHVSPESNPFRPQVYAHALWQAACAVTPVPIQRAMLLRVASGVAAGLLKNAWAAASSRLEAQGIVPGIYRSVVMPSGSVPGRGPAAPDVNSGNAMATLVASMPAGSETMRVGVDKAAVVMGVPAANEVFPAVTAEFQEAVARLEEILRQAPAVAPSAADAAALDRRLGLQRTALLASAGAPGRRQAIEFMLRVFDAFALDPQLPASFAPAVGRLRASALRVALHDPEMLNSTHHAVWRFLDRVGTAAIAAAPATDTRGAAVLGLCMALTDQLAGASSPDANLYRRALAQLDTLLLNQFKAQLESAHATVQSLQLSERRELLERHLSLRLVDQMVPIRTTPIVRRFMTGAWARVLAETILREGEQGEASRGYIKLVDELLWSVQLPDHPKSRQRLLSLLPSMLQRLRAGMASIRLSDAEQTGFLDELMAIHTEALRPSARADEAVLTPEQIVQRMREEVLPPTTGHGGFTDSVIDLTSMETVPAEMMPSQIEPSVEDPIKRVDALQPADRRRLFLHGRWSRVQLLWRSEQGLFFLFAGELPTRTHSITRRALERLAAAGLMQPLEARPLVQRAIDAVMRDVGRLVAPA